MIKDKCSPILKMVVRDWSSALTTLMGVITLVSPMLWVSGAVLAHPTGGQLVALQNGLFVNEMELVVELTEVTAYDDGEGPFETEGEMYIFVENFKQERYSLTTTMVLPTDGRLFYEEIEEGETFEVGIPIYTQNQCDKVCPFYPANIWVMESDEDDKVLKHAKEVIEKNQGKGSTKAKIATSVLDAILKLVTSSADDKVGRLTFTTKDPLKVNLVKKDDGTYEKACVTKPTTDPAVDKSEEQGADIELCITFKEARPVTPCPTPTPTS
jgi:hypothetical protein